MNPRLTLAALLGAPLLLAACTSADTETMIAGLAKAGLSATQASCYSEAMVKTVDAKAFNTYADHLNQGVDLKDAARRTRLKFGTDFSDQMKEIKPQLDVCMR